MTMADNKLTQFLQNNPRMIGVLFTMMVLLTQAGAVAANAASSDVGP